MSDTRLIERWLPIAELGEESVRERRSMTALPPIYYLHVWWARRPLVASRAAILASLLPADADREKFKHVVGIHGDPLESRRKILQARRSGVRFEGDAYSYDRAFTYCPTPEDWQWIRSTTQRYSIEKAVVLDPTAGGGSIPLEAVRLGIAVCSTDLNPVAVLIQRATVEWPSHLGKAVAHEFRLLADRFVQLRQQRLKGLFPPEPEARAFATNYLWARTMPCPYCGGVIPLSPNWRLASDGTGVRLKPDCASGPHDPTRRCHTEIVAVSTDISPGTVADGDAICPFSDCRRVVDNKDVKRIAQEGHIGEQMFAVVFKRCVIKKTKTGKTREKWERGFRAPRSEDDNSTLVSDQLRTKLPEWDALGVLPNERLPMTTESWTHGNTPAQYGAKSFQDLFSSRQLLCNGLTVEVFNELLAKENSKKPLTDLNKAAFTYLALTIDSMLNYGNRSCRWDSLTERVRSVFDRHDFAFCWSYAEMSPLLGEKDYDWIVEKTAKSIDELIKLSRPDDGHAAERGEFNFSAVKWSPPNISIACKSGDALDHLAEGSVDCVVMDPPYYDNVMYAELSDFFYVWLKRTAGQLFPELFRRPLTDKENEAVANVAKFQRQKGAKAMAARDYRERMAAIFAECRRVLKPDGIMTLMFTHKATGAWDALTKGLMQAGQLHLGLTIHARTGRAREKQP